MTFDEHTNRWFDILVECDFGEEIREEIYLVLSLVPSRSAVKKLLRLIITDTRTPDLYTLDEHIRAVLNKDFNDEFRFSFCTTRGQLSAASCLFSSVRQALDIQGE